MSYESPLVEKFKLFLQWWFGRPCVLAGVSRMAHSSFIVLDICRALTTDQAKNIDIALARTLEDKLKS